MQDDVSVPFWFLNPSLLQAESLPHEKKRRAWETSGTKLEQKGRGPSDDAHAFPQRRKKRLHTGHGEAKVYVLPISSWQSVSQSVSRLQLCTNLHTRSSSRTLSMLSPWFIANSIRFTCLVYRIRSRQVTYAVYMHVLSCHSTLSIYLPTLGSSVKSYSRHQYGSPFFLTTSSP